MGMPTIVFLGVVNGLAPVPGEKNTLMEAPVALMQLSNPDAIDPRNRVSQVGLSCEELGRAQKLLDKLTDKFEKPAGINASHTPRYIEALNNLWAQKGQVEVARFALECSEP